MKKHQAMGQIKLIDSTQKAMNQLKVIENLSAYTTVYNIVSQNTAPSRKGSYSLILLNSRENTVSFNTYSASQLEFAVEAYLNLEKKHLNDNQMNVVLVNTGDVKRLEESYPNYFMDTKTLVRNLSLIMVNKFI